MIEVMKRKKRIKQKKILLYALCRLQMLGSRDPSIHRPWFPLLCLCGTFECVQSNLHALLNPITNLYQAVCLILSSIISTLLLACRRPSVSCLSVCLSSVTFVRPGWTSRQCFYTPFGTLAIYWHPGKIGGDRPRGTVPSREGTLNARGVSIAVNL